MGERIRMQYVNWRGVKACRDITPKSIRFGASEWHKADQWLLSAFDHDKQEEREFALVDCDFLSVTDFQRALVEIDGCE